MLIKTQRDDSQQVLISVIDSGIRLDAKRAERLFEAFFTTKSIAGSDRHSKRSPSKAIDRGEMPLGFLTLRERDALRRVVKGLLNKQVARELGTSKITVEIRAAHANDGSLFFLADLVRLAEKPDADR